MVWVGLCGWVEGIEGGGMRIRAWGLLEARGLSMVAKWARAWMECAWSRD